MVTGNTGDNRIYVDLEYCYPGMTRTSGRPSSSDARQVVQIAAIKYDHSAGVELESFDILVRPPFTQPLPEFFVELTGITQQQVDQLAVDYSTALDRFVNFCDDTQIYTFDKDWEVFRQNCGYYSMRFTFEDQPFIRIKAMLDSWGLNPDEYSSGTLYKAAGLQMHGHVHNALHDVRSMAAAVHYFERADDGAKLAR